MSPQDQDYGASTRPELADPYRVFFVTAWGYAADHLYGWFAKVLNLHPEIFALLAHEGSRPKYFRDLTRAERPPLPQFAEFLNDMGMTYEAIGDCYSYRAGQMGELLSSRDLAGIPVLNLTRHPFAWLQHYVSWRASNMRMRSGSSDPLLWEWQSASHARFRALGLAPYAREDIATWATFQGMLSLNGIIGDQVDGVRQSTIEAVFEDDDHRTEMIAFLTQGRCLPDAQQTAQANALRHTLFRGETQLYDNPVALGETWADWQIDAFRKLVTPEACALYRGLGYDLLDYDRQDYDGVLPAPAAKTSQQGPARDLFVSTMFKSGTWMLREVIDALTGWKAYEPPIDHGDGPPDTADETVIDFPPNHYFLWHMTIAPRVAALLTGRNCKKVFLVRNLYSILASAAHHIRADVDRNVGRGVAPAPALGGDIAAPGDPRHAPLDTFMSMVIAGFAGPQMTWPGMAPIIRQMASMMRYAADHDDVVLISYEALAHDREVTIRRLARYLNADSEDRIRNAFALSDSAAMKDKANTIGAPGHVLAENVADFRQAITPYHVTMMQAQLAANFPDHSELSRQLCLPWLFSPDAVSAPTSPFVPKDLRRNKGSRQDN